MDDKEQSFTHPSYGMVQFSHRSGNPKLFASALENHNNYICLSIRQAELIRGPHGDRYFGGIRGDLIEINLSAAQFAQLLTTMNIGMGVPCTISYVNNKRVEDPPNITSEAEGIRQNYEIRVSDFVKEVSEQAAEVKEVLAKPTLNKADRAKIARILERVIQELGNNAPFFVELFQEAAERVVTSAKAEIDAFATQAVYSAGLTALQEQAEVRLQLGAGEKKSES